MRLSTPCRPTRSHRQLSGARDSSLGTCARPRGNANASLVPDAASSTSATTTNDTRARALSNARSSRCAVACATDALQMPRFWRGCFRTPSAASCSASSSRFALPRSRPFRREDFYAVAGENESRAGRRSSSQGEIRPVSWPPVARGCLATNRIPRGACARRVPSRCRIEPLVSPKWERFGVEPRASLASA